MTRDPWLDNLKMTLVTLVVVGHALTLMPEEAITERVYDFVYYWHMPAFVLVSGYLSRHFTWSRKNLTNLLTGIALPYVIFEGLLAAFRIHVGHEEGITDIWLNPHWPMWYLAALFQWRLITPILKLHWIALPLSVVASLWWGTEGSSFFDLNRTIGMLPFFTIGLYLHDANPKVLNFLRTSHGREVGAGLLVGIFVLAAFTDEWTATGWLYYSDAYADFGVPATEGILIRAALLLIATAGAFGILMVVPRQDSWFAHLGSASLVVYLFHGFVVRGAMYAGYDEWAATAGSWVIWLTIVGSIALSLLLAWRPVASRLLWIADPVGSWRRHRKHRVAAADTATAG
ncbi:acyltransferase family protein [Nocardioides sp.]|uniref:acyltransferase family protein n=1 Tax=Nocardioides sp. TaxID=35761 RepID=UPI002BD9B4BB|nr:acyltransferase family protein [Nocardioides sp.]HSX67639.1 acyltransferase family protein [Nocardioides sp.]